jgi:3'-5' exoribonuclease
MNKKIFIKDIQENQSIDDLFLIKEASRAETRGGKPYLIVTVMDRTGELDGRLWEDADRYLPVCRQGAVVRLKGLAQTYKNVLQLKIDAVQGLAENSDRSGQNMDDFLPSTAGDIPAMAKELLSFVNSIRDGHLKNLLLEFFQPGEFFTAFQKAPAAKRMHHAYYGGLLEHTLAVTRLADMLSRLYPVIDRSLLIAGALLHDVGKTEEFSYDSYPFDYTDKGRLVGHLVLGVEMIQPHVARHKNFPAELATRLQHLILSHHGRHEFGSPCLPMTMEAFVLGFIDDIDAKINYLDRLSSQASEPGYQWTDFQKTLERFLYVRGGPLLEVEEMALPSQKIKEKNNPQQSLF